jgi:PIN domain-containing protein
VIERRRLTHVVIDTDAASWLLDPRPLAHTDEARRVIGNRARVVSFVTVTELRYGALRAGWGELRRRQLERSIRDLEVIQPSERLISRCAEPRAQRVVPAIRLRRRFTRPTGGWHRSLSDDIELTELSAACRRESAGSWRSNSRAFR